MNEGFFGHATAWNDFKPARRNRTCRRIYLVRNVQLAILVGLFLGTGLLYGIIPPMLEKTDEEGHYEYILYLREHNSLPPLTPYAQYKQPPIYYVVAAILTGGLPGEVDLSHFRLNPYVAHSVPGHRSDNRNVFLHPPYMTPLFLGARIVSLLFGLGTILTTYYFVRTLLPSRPALAIATAAAAGFQPQFLYITTAIHNDGAITFLSTLVVFLLARCIQQPDNGVSLLLLGGALGFAILAKVSGLLLIPLTLIILAISRKNWKQAGRDAVVVLTVTFLIGGWWYIRNGVLFGDPLTIKSHIAGNTEPERVRNLSEVFIYDLSSIEYTFWANLSRSFVSPLLIDKVLIVWGRISLFVGVIALIKNQERIKVPAILIVAGWPAVYLLALLVYWNSKAAWGFGRLILPAIAPLAFLWVAGWKWILNTLRSRWLFPCAIGLPVVSGVLIPFVSLYPLYHPSQPWRSHQTSEWPGITYVDVSKGTSIARLVEVRPLQAYARPGTYAPIEICWEPLGNTAEPLPMVVSLLDVSPIFSGGFPVLWGYRETYPGLGSAPTDRWMSRAPFCDRVLIWVSPEAPVPLCPAIEIRFASSQDGLTLHALDDNGNVLALPLAGRIPLVHDPLASLPDTSPHYVLDHRIGFFLPEVSLSWNSATITMTWQALQKIPYDATMFVHLMDAQGNLLAQRDRQPLDGRFPTSCWLPGQVITDVVSLDFPSETSGNLRIVAGMYTWPSLERLEVVDASGRSSPERTISLDIHIQQVR